MHFHLILLSFLDDQTRVILTDSNGEGYINASYISVSLILGFIVEKKKTTQVSMRIIFNEHNKYKQWFFRHYIVYDCLYIKQEWLYNVIQI